MSKRLGWSAGLLLLGCLVVMPYGDFHQSGVLPQFWLGVGLMGLGFGLSWGQAVGLGWFWGVAIAARLLLLPLAPGDDVWRYLWEGLIQLQGFSPYELPPTAAELMPYRTDWWSQINHPDVTAIYPPITQLGFRVLAAIAPTVWIFKLAFIAADLGVCWLLCRRFGPTRTLLYAWNPLILYSFAGGAHYDSWLLLPLVSGWRVGEQSRGRGGAIASGLFIGVSVAVKWVTLPVLGFLGWRSLRPWGWSVALLVLLAGVAPLVLTALPFCDAAACPLIPTSSSFVSHGRSAELVPYLVGLVWPASRQANWPYGIPLVLVWGWLVGRSPSFGRFLEGYLGALLVLSPIVHAWYFTWLVPFAVATQNGGVRLVSLSAFVYFVLPHRQALGSGDWFLTPWERLLLWLPLLLGWGWSILQERRNLSSHLSSDLKTP
ncbi:MAG: hypothetical protein VKK04_18535 [Synechococcales bacterium]|nr:hypothetical protein [Synechococcales bacterium]